MEVSVHGSVYFSGDPPFFFLLSHTLSQQAGLTEAESATNDVRLRLEENRS